MSLGTLSRRNVADGIRAFADRSAIPTSESLASFDEYAKASIPDDVWRNCARNRSWVSR